MMFPFDIRKMIKLMSPWCPGRIGWRTLINQAYRLLIIFFLSVYSSPTVDAQSNQVQEYNVKAAFLFNFANFIEWPDRAFPSKEASFVVGVLGDNPFGNALNALRAKNIQGRKVEIRNYSKAEDILGCQILFISGSGQGNLNPNMKSLKGIPILTVSDQDGFCQQGGMINLIPVGNRIGFEVNEYAARQAGIKISSQLLKLARKIVE